MAAGSEDSIVNIGGKGLSLSSSAVYAIANALSKVRIDSSVLVKLSQCKKIQLISSELLGISSSSSKYLTLIESRAALAVLLSKLVLSDAPIRPVLPSLIEETLNSNLRIDRIDFGSVPGFFNSIYSLNNKNIDELGVTVEEGFVVENSLADLIGLCAILDFSCSSLLNLVDVVAALSCETAKADVSAFDLTISGEGFSVKDETDVASDMKVLLFGSKFVGSVDHFSVSDIPVIHGNFRGIVKSVHSRTRVELNSVVRFRKTGCSNNGKGKILVATLLPLITSIRSVGEISLGRAKMSIDSIPVSNERSHVFEIFERHCPNCDILRDKVMSIMGNASLPSDSFGVLHGIYDLLITLRRILAWEAAISLYVLNDVDSDNKIETEFKGLVVDGIAERKNEKKRKKKVLGKGTSIVRQILKERFQDGEDIVNDQVVILVEWAEKLASFFDPVDDSLDSLLKKVKEIVESNEVRRLPKIPKGTRDFGKEQMAIREKAFSTIVGVFKRHGAVALDTPVFELRETLMGKYGEDSKLIYDLADQGGEICSLRYDLTVPFARYLAMNNINSLKRYQIAKVYRRDNPAKGRYREFYQCDFDIAGQYEVMEPDFEVVKVLTELLNELNIGDYEIKLNHRKLLDGMLEICGVPSDKFRTICSSIDKLDKQTFEQIKKEMVEEKGLSNETADKIGSFVSKRGPPLDVLADLKEGSQFLENEGSILALHELEILFKALDKSKCINKIVFDLSLARGLDYYTGVIFEAVFKGTTQVGSIAAGGRYDNLVGMFSGGRQERQVPAVGVSLGIERVFTIMEQLEKDHNQVIRSTETQVLVVILGKDLSLASELVSELWNAKIKAEFSINKRMMKQIERAKQSCIRWMVIVGESEQSGGVAKVKDIEANKEEVVSRERLVEEIQRRLNSDLSTSYVTL